MSHSRIFFVFFDVSLDGLCEGFQGWFAIQHILIIDFGEAFAGRDGEVVISIEAPLNEHIKIFEAAFGVLQNQETGCWNLILLGSWLGQHSIPPVLAWAVILLIGQNSFIEQLLDWKALQVHSFDFSFRFGVILMIVDFIHYSIIIIRFSF